MSRLPIHLHRCQGQCLYSQIVPILRARLIKKTLLHKLLLVTVIIIATVKNGMPCSSEIPPEWQDTMRVHLGNTLRHLISCGFAISTWVFWVGCFWYCFARFSRQKTNFFFALSDVWQLIHVLDPFWPNKPLWICKNQSWRMRGRGVCHCKTMFITQCLLFRKSAGFSVFCSIQNRNMKSTLSSSFNDSRRERKKMSRLKPFWTNGRRTWQPRASKGITTLSSALPRDSNSLEIPGVIKISARSLDTSRCEPGRRRKSWSHQVNTCQSCLHLSLFLPKAWSSR